MCASGSCPDAASSGRLSISGLRCGRIDLTSGTHYVISGVSAPGSNPYIGNGCPDAPPPSRGVAIDSIPGSRSVARPSSGSARAAGICLGRRSPAIRPRAIIGAADPVAAPSFDTSAANIHLPVPCP